MNTQPLPKTPHKKAWITGASSGIGRALCLKLANEGWLIAATARNTDALINLQDQAPKGSLHCYPGDVANSARMKDIMGQILTHFGGLDAAILCAGILMPDNAQNFSAERFQHTIDVNLCGTANVLAPVLSHFQAQNSGHIVLMSSLAAYMGMEGFLSYGASKSGVYYMAQSLAADLAHTPIKIQVITPGYVATPLLKSVDTGAQMPIEIADAVNVIVKGLNSNRFEITFPWGVSRCLRLLSCLPIKWAQPVLRRLRQLDPK